jgi:hypothetical protein
LFWQLARSGQLLEVQTHLFGFAALLQAGVFPLQRAWSVAVHSTQVPVGTLQAGVPPLH